MKKQIEEIKELKQKSGKSSRLFRSEKKKMKKRRLQLEFAVAQDKWDKEVKEKKKGDQKMAS